MRPPKTIHIYGVLRDGQWSLMCLDFTLAAQDANLEQAKKMLISQIRSYLNEAGGVDKQHSKYLLSRTAPLSYWAKFWVIRVFCTVRDSLGLGPRRQLHVAATRRVDSLAAA